MINFAREVKDASLIILGIFSAAMGLKGFLLSSRFIDGGVTGISMLVSDVLGYPLAILILIINLPFIALGYRQIGRKFAIKSALAIAGLSFCLFLVKFPDVTSDKLLTAVFGGLFIGAGIGLAIRGGAVLDGTEIAALLVSRTVIFSGGRCNSHSEHIYFSRGGFLSRRRIGFIFDSDIYRRLENNRFSYSRHRGIHGYHHYFDKSNEIRDVIMGRLHRGVTVYKGSGGMGSKGIIDAELSILYCVVTRLEIGNVKDVVKEIDPGAFVTTHSLSDVQGGLIKKSMMH